MLGISYKGKTDYHNNKNEFYIYQDVSVHSISVDSILSSVIMELSDILLTTNNKEKWSKQNKYSILIVIITYKNIQTSVET